MNDFGPNIIVTVDMTSHIYKNPGDRRCNGVHVTVVVPLLNSLSIQQISKGIGTLIEYRVTVL